MKNIKGTDCEKCGGEIGEHNYVVCWDGIASKTVTFHSHCRPVMADTQFNHHIGLKPGRLGFDGKDLG